MMVILLSVAAVVAAAAAAYCAFADGALLAVDADEPQSDPVVAGLVARREAPHRALAFGRIGALLLAGAAAVGALKASAIPPVQVAPLVVVLGILVIVLAESGSRTAGDVTAAVGLARVAGGIVAIERLLRPVVALGNAADRVAARIFPVSREGDSERETTVEQFREVVTAESGVTGESETMLRGVFSMSDLTVDDIMVPRVDVIAIDRAFTWEQVVDRMRSARHSRYPVFEGTLDNVVGVLHAKDLLTSVLAGHDVAGGWQSVVRPAQYIPATKAVDDQLRDFKAARRHLAVVVDEFGGTAGIVTLEDALEVIVGDIRDEHDVEEPDVVREADGRLSLSARVTLEDLSELAGANFEHDDVHTVGGLVYAVIGGVPKQGEAITVAGHRLIAHRVARRRIERVMVERVGDRRSEHASAGSAA